jgi:hypothetical protein
MTLSSLSIALTQLGRDIARRASFGHAFALVYADDAGISVHARPCGFRAEVSRLELLSLAHFLTARRCVVFSKVATRLIAAPAMVLLVSEQQAFVAQIRVDRRQHFWCRSVDLQHASGVEDGGVFLISATGQ